MSYQTYITDALVCGSKDSNTSDRAYLLFTREAGMLWASARSVREERSKHRYALQDFSFLRVSLVRGKGGWRIVGTEAGENAYYTATERERRIVLRNIVRFLRRFVQGESAHAELFDEVERALTIPVSDAGTLETVVSLRLLAHLGYVAPHGAYAAIIAARTPEEALTAVDSTALAAARRATEEAHAVSHL